MKMICCRLSLLVVTSVLLTVNTVAALRMSATLSDGAVLYPCAGRDLTLTWSYSLDSGDVVTSTEWTFQGMSQEVLAVYVDGNFLPTASFSNRVQLVAPAGIVLAHVTPADTGNYSVLVRGTDASGASFTVRRTVVVHVAAALMTDDHQLHAYVESGAVQISTTDQWAISLACGHFTFTGNPPVEVEWTTPTGTNVPSNGYDNGYFKLHLPGPVKGGAYTCRISSSTLQASCLHDNSTEATVHLDTITARLALLEAQNMQKDSLITQLTSSLQALQSGLRSVETCCADCGNGHNICASGTVRLVNGSNAMEGRVEIRVGDSWGTICDDDWDNDDAKVVCNMLGYFASGARAMPQAHFGQGSGRIVLDEVNCTGIEQSLQTCAANPFGMSDCTHQEDAGVICAGH